MQTADTAFDRQNEFSGLRPVGEADIDLAALEACMAEHIDGFEGPPEAAQFKGGQSNPVRDGTATNPSAIHMAEQVRPVAEVAWAYARKAGA